MKTCRLDELCEIQIGRTPSRANPAFWGPGRPWAAIGDMKGDRVIKSTKESITPRGASDCGCALIPKGTVLMSFKLSLGKRAIAGMDLYTNEAIAAFNIRDDEILDRDFLYWALGAVNFDNLVDRAAKGKTLNKRKLETIQIQTPALSEQRRIAGILNKASDLRFKAHCVTLEYAALESSLQSRAFRGEL